MKPFLLLTCNCADPSSSGCLHSATDNLYQACRRGGSNEPPLEVNNGGLKTQTADFQRLVNSGGMENAL